VSVRQFLEVDRVFLYRFDPDWGGVVVVESVGSDWKPIIGNKLKDQLCPNFVQPYKQGRIQAEDIYAAGLTPCRPILAQFQVRRRSVPILQGEELWEVGTTTAATPTVAAAGDRFAQAIGNAASDRHSIHTL